MLARQIAVGFGIALIFPLLVYYGAATFYPMPKYQDVVTAALVSPANPAPEQRKDYEEQRQKQREQQLAYNAAAKDFARVLVAVSTPLGAAAILVGAYLALESIGTGLIFGGIFTVVWGYWGYWQYLDDWIRFVSLLAGFAILIFVGYRRIAGGRASPGVT
jgi:putative Mn2+ efflux pump MntP